MPPITHQYRLSREPLAYFLYRSPLLLLPPLDLRLDLLPERLFAHFGNGVAVPVQDDSGGSGPADEEPEGRLAEHLAQAGVLHGPLVEVHGPEQHGERADVEVVLQEVLGEDGEVAGPVRGGVDARRVVPGVRHEGPGEGEAAEDGRVVRERVAQELAAGRGHQRQEHDGQVGGAADGERELVHAPHGHHVAVAVGRRLVLLVHGREAAERVVAPVVQEPEGEDGRDGERLPDGDPLVVRGGLLVEHPRHAHEDGRDDEGQGDGHGKQGQVPEVHEQGAAGAVAVAVLEFRDGGGEEVQGEVQRDGEGPGQVLEEEADGADPGDEASAVAGALGLEDQDGPGGGELGHAPDEEHGHVPGHVAVDDGGEEADHAAQLLVDDGHARVGRQEGGRRPLQRHDGARADGRQRLAQAVLQHREDGGLEAEQRGADEERHQDIFHVQGLAS